MNNFRFNIIIFMIVGLISSCSSDIRFEKQKWKQKDDLANYSYRDRMLNDLTNNYKLKGISFRQLRSLIGKPDGKTEKDSCFFYYNIIINYGHDIDPVYVKYLEFNINRDSLVTKFEIKEIKY